MSQEYQSVDLPSFAIYLYFVFPRGRETLKKPLLETPRDSTVAPCETETVEALALRAGRLSEILE